MERPTRAQVRERSPLLRGRYPEVPPDPPGRDDLDVVIEDAAAFVSAATGRNVGVGAGEEVPAELVPVALRAVALKAERLDVSSEAENAEQAASGRRLRSITAGPWSETYFGPGDLQVRDGIPQIAPGDPELSRWLWLLCTDEQRDEYEEQAGTPRGHVAAAQVDYRLRGGHYGRYLGW